jgi:hypothetical protein
LLSSLRKSVYQKHTIAAGWCSDSPQLELRGWQAPRTHPVRATYTGRATQVLITASNLSWLGATQALLTRPQGQATAGLCPGIQDSRVVAGHLWGGEKERAGNTGDQKLGLVSSAYGLGD